MVPLVFIVIALVMVIVGVLIMTQVVSLQQLGSAIGRLLSFLWAVIALGIILRLVLLPILECALVWLKTATVGALVIAILVIVLMVLSRIAFMKCIKPVRDYKKENRNESST
jgi:hypothetical protein